MAIELYCNQSINGTLSTTGTGTFGGDVTIGGTTGSTGNALSVNRGSDGSQALRVQNSGEVVVNVNYLYAASSGTSLYVQNTAVFRGSIVNDGGDVTIADTLSVTGDATFSSDITVSGGDITLGGTGRIQGVDTVSAGTDAANKTYVDNAVSGSVTSVATGSGLTGGTITTTGTVSVDYGSSGLIADAPSGSGTPDIDDLLLIGLDSTGSGETRSYVIGDLPFGAGTMSSWNLTADSGGSFSVGNGTTVDIAGGTNITTTRTGATVSINNSITNNNQLTNGAGYTTNTGTVTGTGANGRIAFWDSSSNITGTAGLTFNTTGDILYVNGQIQVKGVGPADYSVAGDTDTGLGSFDGSNGVSLVSKGKKIITVKEGDISFNEMTATAVATTGSLSANQGNQAVIQDTLATLAVDPSGNVVRGEQEGTWTFTRAQLNATLGNTLISAPGANKAIIVTESDWMVKYSATGAVSGNQSFDIRQANIVQANANISTLPGARINEIINASQGTPTNPSYGFCARDIPLTTRTYKTNVATTLNKKTGDQLPAGVISISIKLKYRLFNATTF